MRTNEILREIKRLPVSKRIYLVEKIIHSIRLQEDENAMLIASDALYADYATNKDLTAFTNIDYEDFHEAK